MSTPQVIGQGTYGCVHKPSLKCKDSTGISYTNKVSKILRKTDAKKEIAEYKNVDKADKKHKFYLGKPEACELDTTSASNKNAIHDCKIGDDVLRNLKNYDLIIMKDGGENMETYVKKMKTWAKSEMSTELCEKFLLESLRLFAGLKAFEDNDLIHHDLKPQNIVFNAKNNRLNFIDFGLMQSRKKLIKQANNSKYKWSIFHWSYPWELEFLDKNIFNRISSSSHVQDLQIRTVRNDLNKDTTTYGKHSKTFFHYNINGPTQTTYDSNCNNYVAGYEMTIKEDMRDLGYEAFLERSMKTIDIFGVGMAMNYWLHEGARRHLDLALANELEDIFKYMTCPHLKYRYKIDELIEKMEEVITKSGLLEKHDKKIVNHIVVDSTTADSVEKPIHFKKLAKPSQTFVNSDPMACPEGKERNPKTGRCIKIKAPKVLDDPCPPGKQRNPATGRCIKIKPVKTVKSDTEPCPAGKERNPKTRRCVNKCKDGYARDANFRCTKKKRP